MTKQYRVEKRKPAAHRERRASTGGAGLEEGRHGQTAFSRVSGDESAAWSRFSVANPGLGISPRTNLEIHE
jgi:hypothetical protein